MSIEERLARSAPALDAAIDAYVSGSERRREHRWIAVAAAMVLVIAGVIGVAALRDRSARVAPPAASIPVPVDSTAPASTEVESRPGSALMTPLASDVQALVVPSQPGWRIDATSGFLPVAVEPSTGCPGCGADRLVVVGEGGLAGPMFTAWSVEVPVEMGDFDHDVTVGGVPGRATSSPAGTPLADVRVTVAWRLGDGPGALTALVDAKGVSEEQVLEWAGLLSWEETVPALPVRPAGFTVADEPTAAPVEIGTYLTSADGRSTIELYAVNTGVHGLVDWRSLGPLIRWTSVQRTVDGVDVALDPAEPVDEQPITTISASWVAGGWGYVAVGHVFDDEAEFLDAVRSLRLADPATYAAAAADASEYFLPEWATTTGWNVTAINPEQVPPAVEPTG